MAILSNEVGSKTLLICERVENIPQRRRNLALSQEDELSMGFDLKSPQSFPNLSSEPSGRSHSREKT
jgi:hypothetical protein